MLLIFDTETTGLTPGQICQLSYVMAGHTVTAKNFFFAVDFMPMAAAAVHGFSKEHLDRLSEGNRFADCHQEILADFKAADVIAAHNLDFDLRFLKKEFSRCGVNFRPRRGLCTMYYFTKALALPARSGRGFKPPSLRELGDFFSADESQSADCAENLFGCRAGAHDARGDVAATYLCVERAIERGLLRNLIKETPTNEALEG